MAPSRYYETLVQQQTQCKHSRYVIAGAQKLTISTFTRTWWRADCSAVFFFFLQSSFSPRSPRSSAMIHPHRRHYSVISSLLHAKNISPISLDESGLRAVLSREPLEPWSRRQAEGPSAPGCSGLNTHLTTIVSKRRCQCTARAVEFKSLVAVRRSGSSRLLPRAV